MSLNPDTKKRYRTIGHGLKPVVIIAGKGLTEGVLNEVNRALDDHELIKVKLAMEDREERKQVVGELCEQAGAEVVQTIGKVVLMFRSSHTDGRIHSPQADNRSRHRQTHDPTSHLACPVPDTSLD